MRDDEYLALKDRAADQFLNLPHVNAVAIGPRERNGQFTGELAIKVFVTRKTPAATVPPDELIPPSFEGVPTDVVEMGPMKRAARPLVPGATHPRVMVTEIQEFDPLRGGGSLGHEGGRGVGTLGCMLQDKEDGSAIYALTNFHVISVDGKLSHCNRVSHPAQRTSDFDFEFDPAFPIGIVADGADDALRDAAVVRLAEGTTWIPFIEGIGFIRGSRDVTASDIQSGTFQLRKRGVRTRLTGGIVTGIGDTKVENTRKKNNLLIRPNPDLSEPGEQTFFAFSGDSGSVVVNDDNEVAGLFWASDDGTGQGMAFPIGTVLRRFRDVEKLDLEVAVAQHADADDANPNDPHERRTVPPPAGAPTLAGPEQIKRADHHYYRPLLGGAQILATPFGAANAATLGCIVTESDETAYVLTAFSGISAGGHVPPTSDTKVGQPDNDDSLTGCCSNTCGHFAHAGPDPHAPTIAIAKLKDDQKWLAEIMGIGLVDGSSPVTLQDLSLFDPYTVRKHGASSGLTSGAIVRIPASTTPPPPGVPADAILIRPHPNPLKPHDDIHFSRVFDRGAALVNSANKVVAVLYDETDIPDADGRHVIHGIAAPIDTVLQGLKTNAGVDVQVATATEINTVHTTSARTALPDEERVVVVSGLSPPIVVSGFSGTSDALVNSPAGAEIAAAWRLHQHEVFTLLAHNRKVATVWHRSGGPALAQAFVRAVRTTSFAFPGTVNGVSIATCIDRVCSVFCRYGTESLRRDITRLRPLLPDIAGLTFAEIIAALDLAAAAQVP
jgi:hypothetical protein